MQHISDDDLTLRYYGEDVAAGDGHLAACAECRARYQALQRVLNVVDVPVPQRASEYEAEVWNRLSPKLGVQRRNLWFAPRRWASVLLMASLVVTAFVLGRFLPAPTGTQTAEAPASERVMILAVGHHLERSQMVLAELVNAASDGGTLHIGDERSMAQSLVGANRLYRTAAVANGDAGVAMLLDDLERVLLEVAHSPDDISASDLEAFRERVEEQGLLFKIRVVGSRLKREREETSETL
jgi:anti-sigma factor RsiW